MCPPSTRATLSACGWVVGEPGTGIAVQKYIQSTTPTPNSNPQQPPARKRPPQSQSLSQSYGSNLPTSLAYIALKTRGSSPWRPDAVIGTARCKSPLPLAGQKRLPDFSRNVARTPEPCTNTHGLHAHQPSTLSGQTDSGACLGSSRGDVSTWVCRHCRRGSCLNSPRCRFSCSRAPDITAQRLGGHGQEQTPASLLASPPNAGGTHPLLSRTLGPPHPRRNALPVEPFSTSAYKVPACILATHTKICTRPRSTPAHAGASPQGPRLLTHTRARAWWRISLPLERHPFSGLLHSAGMLLHTSERVPTSMGTVLLSS